MNYFLISLVVVTVLTGSVKTGLGGQEKWYQAIVTHVIDGDTIQVRNGKQTATVRLWGIDAPEWDQPYSLEGKRFLKKLILYKEIEMQYFYTDDYDRLIAQLKYKNQNINELLVQKGYAWVYDRYCNKPICRTWKNSEKKARRTKRGLWKDDKPISPWQWKWKKE